MIDDVVSRPGRPRITVAIPVYNREELVKCALESALREPHPDLEIIVVDNASTDRTWEVLQGYRDPRLRLVRNPRNLGLFGNFNRCFELTNAPYVCTLCSDDALLPGFLGPAADLLDRHPHVGIVSSRGTAIVGATGTTRPLGSSLAPGIYPRETAIPAVLWAFCTYYTNPFNYPSGTLLRTETARRLGGMEEPMSFGADVRLYLKMLEESDLAVLDIAGCAVLLHSDQEAAKIHDDLTSFREFTGHFETYAGLLAEHGVGDYVRGHLAGYLIGSAFKLYRQGRRRLATQLVSMLREKRLPLLTGLLGGLDSMRQRSRLRRTGPTGNPFPVQPLGSAAGGRG